MVSTVDGPRLRDPDPVSEECPFCLFTGPRIAVYRHIGTDHPEADPADFFEDPLGA